MNKSVKLGGTIAKNTETHKSTIDTNNHIGNKMTLAHNEPIKVVQFTFLFLVSNALTQKIILGYTFSNAFHIGSTWNKNDKMCLTMKGHIIATTVRTTAINALVQCAESITI